MNGIDATKAAEQLRQVRNSATDAIDALYRGDVEAARGALDMALMAHAFAVAHLGGEP